MKITFCRVVLLAISCWAVSLQGGQFVSNPGFDTGSLSPWFQGTDFTGPGEDWNVTSADKHSRIYCVTATGNKELRQNFTPTPSSSVTSITFWIKHPNATGDSPVEVWLFYDGSPSSGRVYQVSGTSWQLVDVTSQLTPGKSLKGIAISGYFDGGPSPRTYIDDVSIMATEAPVLLYPSAASTCLYFAQLADGGPAEQKWTTTVMFVNPSITTATSVTVTFYGNEGELVALDFGTGPSPTLTLNLPPGGTKKLTSTGASSSTVIGWALAVADIPITGTVLYQASANGTPRYGVAAAGTGPTYYYNSFGTDRLGVALANPSSTQTIHLQVVAKDQNGVDAGSKGEPLDPRHHTVFNLGPELGLPDGFIGSMTITSTDDVPGPFVAWALHADVEKDLLSPLPPGELLLPAPYERRASDLFARVRAAAGPVLRTIAEDPRNFNVVTVAEVLGYLAPMGIWIDSGTTIAAGYQDADKKIHISRPMLGMLGGSDGALAFLIAREAARGVTLITGQNATDMFLGVTNPDAALDSMALLLLLKAGLDPNGAADFYGRLAYAYLQQIPIDASVLAEFSVPNGTGSRMQDLATYMQTTCNGYPRLGCAVVHNLWHPYHPAQIP